MGSLSLPSSEPARSPSSPRRPEPDRSKAGTREAGRCSSCRSLRLGLPFSPRRDATKAPHNQTKQKPQAENRTEALESRGSESTSNRAGALALAVQTERAARQKPPFLLCQSVAIPSVGAPTLFGRPPNAVPDPPTSRRSARAGRARPRPHSGRCGCDNRNAVRPPRSGLLRVGPHGRRRRHSRRPVAGFRAHSSFELGMFNILEPTGVPNETCYSGARKERTLSDGKSYNFPVSDHSGEQI